jgi:diacylglycerol kinase family enzyme
MAEQARAAVVINPVKVLDLDARRAEIGAALADAGWPAPLWLPTTADDPGCGQARDAVAAGVEVVFACGGDGTVMACAGVLAGTAVALAVIPSGTGNLLAANLGLTSDVVDAVRVATAGGRRRVDVGAVSSVDSVAGSGADPEPACFTVMAGMGFDAEMIDATSDSWKARIGWLAYVVAGVRRLHRGRLRVRISLDGARPFRRRARTVLVANVGRLQGGITLLPDAEPDDGLLDVAVLTPRTLRHWLRLAYAVLRRRPQVPGMETFRARSVDIRSDTVQPRELDGDVIAPARSLTVEVRPQALTVCVPDGAATP